MADDPVARSMALFAEFVATGDTVGADAAFYRTMARNPDLFRQVLARVRDGSWPDVPDGQPAEAVIYDAATVLKMFGLSEAEAPSKAIVIPPRGWLTFYDPGLNLKQLAEIAKGKGIALELHADIPKRMEAEEGKPRYRQISLGVVPKSLGVTTGWQRRETSGARNKPCPSVRTLATAVLIHLLSTRQSLLGIYTARCTEKFKHGKSPRRAFVSCPTEHRIQVDSRQSNTHGETIGWCIENT
jgi:hypothetical protein